MSDINSRRTLVIHPKDQSTWFLDITYKNIPNKTVLTSGTSREEVKDLIRSHDRIMMMGHGSPGGLFCVGQFRDAYGFVIDRELVPLLREKRDSVFIWCHADEFVYKNGLHGFSTGMFISEVGEAMYCGVKQADQPMVDEQNFLFVNEVGRVIEQGTEALYDAIVLGPYGELAKRNPVATYNHKRIRAFTHMNNRFAASVD